MSIKQEILKLFGKHSKRHNSNGHEQLDSAPCAKTVKFQQKPLSDYEKMLNAVTYMSRMAQMQGEETFDEADDFSVPDESDPLERFFTATTPFMHDVDLSDAYKEAKLREKTSSFEVSKPSGNPVTTPLSEGVSEASAEGNLSN